MEAKSRENPPDLVILDWMMPGISGAELCRRLRIYPKTAQTPIIVLTPPEVDLRSIRGVATGIDDCIVKPFSIPKFLSRVRSLLRPNQGLPVSSSFRVADIELDCDRHRVIRNGRDICLGPTEFRLLEFLIQRPGHVFTRQDLIHGVWGKDGSIGERTVDVHIGRLRRAITIGKRPDPIRTVRGSGYSIEEERDLSSGGGSH